jgi:hypothetical protein
VIAAVLHRASREAERVDPGFALMVGGLFGIWIGGGNLVARRIAARRWSRLGTERTAWSKWGFFVAPDWVSLPIFIVGCLLLVIGTLIQLLS